MDAKPLEQPRVSRGFRWFSSDKKKMTLGHFTIVYSPTSSAVYLHTGLVSGDDKILEEKNLDLLKANDIARIRGLFSELGLKRVELFIGSLCDFGALAGYGDWIPFTVAD